MDTNQHEYVRPASEAGPLECGRDASQYSHNSRRLFFGVVAILLNYAMTASSLIVSDPDILGGTPVFKGTRVPVRTMFEYLADGLSLEYFLESFPSVTREQATDVLRLSQQRIEQEIAA
jgi:uncharacterized protein (DUF433 family)